MLQYAILLSFSLVICLDSLQSQPEPYFSQFKSNISFIPSNYSIQTTYSTTYPPSYITYSPDQNWIVYNTFKTNLTNRLFLRPRYNDSVQYNVTLGNSSIPIQRVSSFGFSLSGDLLFVGTWSNYIFVCNFSMKYGNIMQDEDCMKSYYLGNYNTIDTVKVNSVKKLVAGGDDNLWIFNFTAEGDLELQNYIKFPDVTNLYPLFHPKAQKDTLIVYGRNTTYTKGFITIYNITSKFMNTLKTSGVYHLNILNDSQTLISTQYYLRYTLKVTQYQLSLTQVQELGTVAREGIYILQISQTADVVVGWNLNRSQPVLYQVIKSPAYSPNLFAGHQTIDRNMITLKQISHIEGNFQLYPFRFFLQPLLVFIVLYFLSQKEFSYLKVKFLTIQLSDLHPIHMSQKWSNCYTISTDVNDIFLPVMNSTLILRYSLCLDNTYFSRMECLNCSSLCKSCHISPNICFECVNNTYFLKDSSCLQCNTMMIGCSSCLNSSYCLSCDKSAGFVQNPINNTCTCPNSYTLFSGQCFACFVQDCDACNQNNICYECKSGLNVSGSCIKGAIIGIIILGCLLFAIILTLFIYRRCKKSHASAQTVHLLQKAEDQIKQNQSIIQK